MTDLPELNVEQQIKIARASRAGVAPQRIADHLGVTVAQVNATIALEQKLHEEDQDFAAWIEANKIENLNDPR